jgi:diguanylate cyclase (GGDEF)-like protein
VAISFHLLEIASLARYGGEEFVVLLPNTSATGARLVARRLHESIENLTVAVNDLMVQVIISLGVAQIGPKCATLEKLLKCADQAVYQAKAAGRNQVFVLD